MGVIKNFINGVKKIITGKEEDDKKPSSSANKLTKAEADMRASSAEMNASAKQQKASGKTEAKTTVKPKEVKLDNKAFTPAAKTTNNWPSGEKLTRDFINYYGYDPRGTVNKAAATNGGIKSEASKWLETPAESNTPSLTLNGNNKLPINKTPVIDSRIKKWENAKIGEEVKPVTSMTASEKSMRQASEDTRVWQNERKKYSYVSDKDWYEFSKLQKREQQLRPLMDDIAEARLNRVTKYMQFPTVTSPADKQNEEEVRKREDRIIDEYKFIDSKLKNYEGTAVSRDETGTITDVDHKKGVNISKSQQDRADRIAAANPMTIDEYERLTYKTPETEASKLNAEKRTQEYGARDLSNAAIEAYEDVGKHKNKKYDDNLGGVISGNYRLGSNDEKAAEVSEAIFTARSKDTTTADVYEYLNKTIEENNKKTFEKKTGLTGTVASISRYAPQFINQTKASVAGGVAGATAGFAVGNVAGAKIGYNIGSAAASAEYAYKHTAGTAYVRLIKSDADISVEDAAKLAKDEALASAVVEFGLEAAAGFLVRGAKNVLPKRAVSGTEKVMNALTDAGIGRKATTRIIKTSVVAGKLALDSLGEGLEESIQTGISFTADRVQKEGRETSALGLLTESFNIAKYTDEELEEMFKSGKQGAILAPFASGIHMGIHGSFNHSISKAQGSELITSGFADSVLSTALKAEGTNSQLIAKTIQEEMSKGNTVNKATWGELASSMKSDGITVSKKGKNDSFVYTKEGGGLATTAAGSALSSATRYQLDRLGRTTGKNIIPVVRQSETDGWMDTNDNSRFYVNVNSKEPVTYTAIHELTHTARGSEAYEAFKKYVIDIIKAADEAAYKRMMLNIKQKYLSMNGSFKSDSFCEDEIVADVAKKINGSYSEMLKVLDSHPTFGKQLGDKMIELYQNIRGANKSERYNPFDEAEAQSIEQAAKLWTQAMQEKGMKAEYHENDDGMMYSINEDFVTEYDSWVADGKPDRRTLVVGTTSEALQSIGVKDQNITWDTSKINDSLKKHNYLDDTIMKQIPYVLEKPIIVMNSKKFQSRITMFGEVFDGDGVPVMAVLELMPLKNKKGIVLDEIKLVSTHSRKNKNNAPDMTQTQSIIDTSEILYIEPDKKRTNNWLTRTGLQLPFGVTNYGSIKSVTYPERNVNTYYANNSENDTEEIYSMDYSEATDDGKKVSKVYDNSIMGKGTYKEIQSTAEARVAEFMYDGISNKETYEAAQKKIESLGVDKATQKILAKAASAEAWTADDTASALALMAHHQTEGNVDIAVDIASAARAKLTQAGQAIQAMAMIDKLTPEGKFITLAREAESVNESAEKQVRKKGKKAAEELEEAKRKDKARAKQRAGEQLEIPKNADEGSNAPRDITKVLKKPEDEAPDITKVMKKPSAEDKTTTVPKPESAKGDGKKNIPSKKKAPEKSEVEKVFEKYGVDYVSQDELKKMSETFKVINDLKTKEDLIELIMKQSKQRGTVHNNTLRKALNKQDIKLLTDVANQQVFGMLKDKVKRSLGRKVSTYQTISHLLNARTMARNVVSNAAFNVVDTVANAPVMLVDLALSLGTKNRTVGSDRGVFEKGRYAAAMDRATKKYIDVALDVNSSMDPSKYAEGFNGRTFKGKVLGGAERMMTYGLTVTDEFAKGATEHNIYEGLKRLKNNPFTEEEMREIAREEARYRTFQDDNLVSDVFRGLKNTLNHIPLLIPGKKGKVYEFSVGDLVVKYTQVPGALISRSVEFSPLGGLKAINVLYQMHKNGTGMTPQAQREFALSLGRAFTGTGLIATFALLSKLGLFLNDDEDEDKDLAALKKAEGMSGMQLNISALQRLITGKQKADTSVQSGDKLVSIAFLEPLNSVIAKGIVLARGDGAGIEDWMNAVVSKSWEEVADMSTMQTLRTIIGGFGGSSSVGEIVLGISGDAITGFIPAPVRQLAAIMDPIQRNPYKAGNAAEKLTGKVMQSLPGLSKKVPAKVTPFGEDKNRSTGSLVGDILNNTVNPGYMNIYQPGEVSKLVYKLSEYNINALPRVAPNSFTVDGVKYKLTGEDYAEFSRMLGRNTNDMIKEYATSEEYYIVENQERADRIAEIVSKAYSKSKAEYLNSKGIMPAPEKKGGVNFGDYDAVTRFNGLPGKEYLEYDGVKYEITETMKAKYDKTIEIYTDKTELKVIEQNIPLNSIEGFEKAYYYEEGADGKRHRVSYNKPYSEYPMSVKKKIINKIKELAGEQVHEAMKNKVIQGATGSYIIDEETAAAIEKGDFSKNQWVRVGTKEATGGTVANKVISTAKQYIGTPYVWGGSTPKGFDCSGLMQYVYKQNGIELSRTAAQQFRNGTPVNKNNLKPGDMVFFTGSTGSVKAPGHVGMYLGNDQFLHAPQTGDVVKVSSLSSRKDYVGARRVL